MGIRCFIAIELQPELKNNISFHMQKLISAGADVKWVVPENLHLTLKFLGSTPEEKIPDISKQLATITKSHNNFSLCFSGAGVFPNIKFPRVVWLGAKDSDDIIKLQKDIENAMAELGFNKEKRRFTAHLTLGRVRSFKNKEPLMNELATLKDMDFGKIEVKSIALMKSELKPGGAVHQRLAEFVLGN